jgi:hypothetical protein
MKKNKKTKKKKKSTKTKETADKQDDGVFERKAASAAHAEFSVQVGSDVMVSDLKSKPELNGRTGVIESLDQANGR